MKELELETKVDEIIENVSKYLKSECMRLARSGGINIHDFGGEDDYTLPKILLTVAMMNVKDYYYPLHPKWKSEVTNLSRF